MQIAKKENGYIQTLLFWIFVLNISDKWQTKLCLFLVYYMIEIKYLIIIPARKIQVIRYKSHN